MSECVGSNSRARTVLCGREMNTQPRYLARELQQADIPSEPGVYVWYRNGKPVYVGKAKRLHKRLWRHLGAGASMSGSALRRNVAEFLGIAKPADIKAGLYKLSVPDLFRVRAFIEECEVAWVGCRSAGEALLFEGHLKHEWMPPLTKL